MVVPDSTGQGLDVSVTTSTRKEPCIENLTMLDE
jgi:hypothetical protein